MWRSLVARTLGVGEVPSSNLGIPMNKACCLKWQAFRFGLYVQVSTACGSGRVFDRSHTRPLPQAVLTPGHLYTQSEPI